MTLSVILVLCFVTTTLQVYDVTAWSFSPPTLPLPPTQKALRIAFMCQADTPLVKCQVSMYTPRQTHDFIDLSLGENSSIISRYHETKGNVPIYNVSYFGTGLKNGQCGAVYASAKPMELFFGCRGANAGGEWQDMVLILAMTVDAIPATISPLKAIVKPGDDVNVLLHSGPLLYCLAIYRNSLVVTSLPGIDQQVDENHRYFGTGYANGDCGVSLLNVTERDNGPLTLLAVTRMTGDKEVAQLASVVIIAAPPAQVSLIVDKLNYSVGETLTAKCSSLLSRPVANLTWTLDDRIIRQDGKRDGGEDEVWSWSWERQSITQTVSLTLEEEHFGKKLECRVQHLDYVITNTDYVITHV